MSDDLITRQELSQDLNATSLDGYENPIVEE